MINNWRLFFSLTYHLTESYREVLGEVAQREALEKDSAHKKGRQVSNNAQMTTLQKDKQK
jgi:hypothetical protein